MDKFLPTYQFSERHQATVHCGPGELLDVIQNFQPPQRRDQRDSNVCASAARKMDALGGPFGEYPTYAIHRGRSHSSGSGRRQRNCRWAYRKILASGLRVVRRQRPFRISRLQSSENPKLLIGFFAEQLGEVTLLTTETRVYCSDRYSLMMFCPYWLIIRPISGLLRRRALETIRRIAEARAASVAL